MFHPATAIRLLRDTLNVVAAEWVLWALDAEGVFWLHEGPGVWRKGVRPGEMIGKNACQYYAGDEAVLAFMQEVRHGPTTRALVFNGHRFLVAGGPDTLGGVSGLALALGAEGVAPSEASVVIEASRPIAEIGAAAGDLLVVDPQQLDRVGVYRSVEISALPAAVRAELGALSRAFGVPVDWPVADDGAAPPHRAPAAHLRLLP